MGVCSHGILFILAGNPSQATTHRQPLAGNPLQATPCKQPLAGNPSQVTRPVRAASTLKCARSSTRRDIASKPVNTEGYHPAAEVWNNSMLGRPNKYVGLDPMHGTHRWLHTPAPSKKKKKKKEKKPNKKIDQTMASYLFTKNYMPVTKCYMQTGMPTVEC